LTEKDHWIMGRGQALSERELGEIDVWKELGTSNRDIGRKLGRSHKVINNYLRLGDSYNQTFSTGRPKKTTARVEREIIRLASTKQKSVTEIQREVPHPLSVGTIYKIISDCPFTKWCKKIGQPPLTKTQREQTQVCKGISASR